MASTHEETPGSGDVTDNDEITEISLPPIEKKEKFDTTQQVREQRRKSAETDDALKAAQMRDALRPIEKKVVPLRPSDEPVSPAEIPHFLQQKAQPEAPVPRKGPNSVQRALRNVLRFFGFKV